LRSLKYFLEFLTSYLILAMEFHSSTEVARVSQALSSLFLFLSKESCGKSGCHPLEIRYLGKATRCIFRQGQLPNPFLYSKRRAIILTESEIQSKIKREISRWNAMKVMSLGFGSTWKADPIVLSAQKCQENSSCLLQFSCFCLWRSYLEQKQSSSPLFCCWLCFLGQVVDSDSDLSAKDKKPRGRHLKINLGSILWWFSLISRKSNFWKVLTCSSWAKLIQQAGLRLMACKKPSWAVSLVCAGKIFSHWESSPTKDLRSKVVAKGIPLDTVTAQV